MVAFPLTSALISLACALVIARDALRRPRPDKVAWAVAFAIFTLAAGSEVAGSLWGWSASLARVYYLTGAVLVVGYLAVGELYLLAGRRWAAIAPGATLLVTALAAAVVLGAPVDASRLDRDGWEAIERGPGLTALAASVNALGTVVLVGGALLSAWRFWRVGQHRHRMTGCVLIAVGTVVVAAGGTLTRFGHREYLYIAMAAGVAIIFGGYLEARRPDTVLAAAAGMTTLTEPTGEDGAIAGSDATTAGIGKVATTAGRQPSLVSLPGARLTGRRSADRDAGNDPAIVFLETRLLPLDDAGLDRACRDWSVPRREIELPDRDEARRAWAVRLRLSPEGQLAFDRLGVSARLQLSELYHEVLAPGVTARAEEHRPRMVAPGG